MQKFEKKGDCLVAKSPGKKKGNRTIVGAVLPDHVRISDNIQKVQSLWIVEKEKILNEFARVFERSHFLDIDQLLVALNTPDIGTKLEKIFEGSYLQPLRWLYERLECLITQSSELQVDALRATILDDVYSNPDNIMKKQRIAFGKIVMEIKKFEEDCVRTRQDFEVFCKKQENLGKKINEIKESLTYESEEYFKKLLFYVQYTLDEVEEHDVICSIKQTLAVYEPYFLGFQKNLNLLRECIPLVTDCREHYKLLWEFWNDAKETQARLSSRLKTWEDVFSSSEIDPYLTFKYEKDAINKWLDITALSEIAALLPIEVDVLSLVKKFEGTGNDFSENLKILRTKLQALDFEQDTTLSEEEQSMQRIIVVTIYGVTCMSSRPSGGRIMKTYGEILVNLGKIMPEERGFYNQVFDKTVAASNPLVVENKERNFCQFDFKSKTKSPMVFYLLSDLGKRQAKTWMKEYPGLAENALAKAREISKNQYSMKQRSTAKRKKT